VLGAADHVRILVAAERAACENIWEGTVAFCRESDCKSSVNGRTGAVRERETALAGVADSATYTVPNRRRLFSGGYSEMSAMTVISGEGINFAFGEGELRKQILFEVKLQIQSGEIVLLTGPSGSGKTTLLTLIAGLRGMQEGHLTVLGHALHHATREDLLLLRRKIGFIFQAHNLLPFLTARQNVQIMFDLHPEVTPMEARRRTVEILQRVGLGDRVEYPISKLSGGQRQRVAIARSLVSGPSLVLADEPTSALDSVTGREVVSYLQFLAREEGRPILLVTHDPRILDIADRVLTMQDGRLTEAAMK
jgi:putative ABC transport system ATP-binding protein